MSGTKIINPQNQFGENLAVQNTIKENKSFFHSFSRLPINNSLSLLESFNKAGHTITLSDIWADSLPVFLHFIDTENIDDITRINFSVNDIIQTIVQGEIKTLIYNGSTWDEITLTDNTVLSNKKGVEVIKFHKNKPLTVLTKDNNPVDSKGQAFRLFIDNKPVISFVSPVDIFQKELNLPSKGYNVNLYSNGELITDNFYIDYYTGILIIDPDKFNYDPETLSIDCYEYIGTTLDSTVERDKDYLTVTRVLTTEEKQNGLITVNGAKDLISLSINSTNVFIPYTINSNNITIKLFDTTQGETAENVYNGFLISNSITYTFLI